MYTNAMFRCSNILRLTSLSRVVPITIIGSKSFASVGRRVSPHSTPRCKLIAMTTNRTLTSSNYCDNFFTAQRIKGLPRQSTTDDGLVFEVNYASQADVASSLESMLQSSCERGDNVGTDEFQGPYKEYFIERAFVFTARWSHIQSSPIAAFIIIGPSTFSRTIDASLADIHVIRASDVPDSIYFKLIDTAVELTRQLDVGFMDCILSVSVSCESLINVLTNQLAFTVAATIPDSVHMANGIGLVDSKVLVRNIFPPGQTRQPRTREEVLTLLARHGVVDGREDDDTYNKMTLPSVPFLPQQYFYKRANLLVNVRNMHKHEDREAFEMLDDMARHGAGIPLTDIPTLASFRRYMLALGECVVYEDAKNGRMVGWSYSSLSWLTRSPSSKSIEGTTIITNDYQNCGIGRETFLLASAIAKQLGYKSILNDYFANNVRSGKSASGVSSIVGILPRAAYLVGAGWQDQVLVHGLLNDSIPTFSQLVNENRQIRQVNDRPGRDDQSKL